MDLIYLVTKFLHVAGALLLAAALAIEAGVLRGLTYAQTPGDTHGALCGLRLMRGLAPVAGLLVIVPGLYLAWDAWGLPAWLAAALGALLVAVVMEVRVTRKLFIAYEAAVLARVSGGENELLLRRMKAGYVTRVLLLAAIVALMVIKPGAVGATIALVAAGAMAAIARPWVCGHAASHSMPARDPERRVIAIGDRGRGR